MCGIVAYVGYREAAPIILKGLQRLEYRGYDSAGIALLSDGELKVYKKKGKVAALRGELVGKELSAGIGIGHTRWATHGEPNDVNAHPHYANSNSIAIIHNGIIENYASLKKRLLKEGFTFSSDTDTEVLINFIEYVKISKDCSTEQAVRLALQEVIGAYAIVVIDKEEPKKLIAARKGSPLVIGVGENEFFFASDATPIIEYTKEVVYLEDYEIAVVADGELKIKNLENVEKGAFIQTVELELEAIEKGGDDHCMLKEIFEQPR
ncbi:MAG: class II glutamine amidotransferase, partial [Spirosomataceae bacterium]